VKPHTGEQNEENVSTKQLSQEEKTRLQGSYGHKRRKKSLKRKKTQGTQASRSVGLEKTLSLRHKKGLAVQKIAETGQAIQRESFKSKISLEYPGHNSPGVFCIGENRQLGSKEFVQKKVETIFR